jgi:hypothetical protein
MLYCFVFSLVRLYLICCYIRDKITGSLLVNFVGKRSSFSCEECKYVVLPMVLTKNRKLWAFR